MASYPAAAARLAGTHASSKTPALHKFNMYSPNCILVFAF